MVEHKIELNDGIKDELRMTGNNLKDVDNINDHCVLQKQKIVRHRPRVQNLEIEFLKLKESEPSKGTHLVEELFELNEIRVHVEIELKELVDDEFLKKRAYQYRKKYLISKTQE